MISANALLCKGLYVAGYYFKRDDWVDLANQCLEIIVERINQPGHRYYLNDLVYALDAILAGVAFASRDNGMAAANHCWSQIMDLFYDHHQGGAWFSQELHQTPISRIKEIHDQAVPAENALLMKSALTLYDHNHQASILSAFQQMMHAFMNTALSTASGCESYWLALKQCWKTLPNDNIQFYECRKVSEKSLNLPLI